METITLSVNKVAIGIALVVGLVVGGIIGCIAGSHHARYEGRGQFQGNYGSMRGARPMMDQDAMNKMMENRGIKNTETTPVPLTNPTK